MIQDLADHVSLTYHYASLLIVSAAQRYCGYSALVEVSAVEALTTTIDMIKPNCAAVRFIRSTSVCA